MLPAIRYGVSWDPRSMRLGGRPKRPMILPPGTDRMVGMRRLVAGIDLGGTAINYTLLDADTNEFLVKGLSEHPARAADGPVVCLAQIATGLAQTATGHGAEVSEIVAAGLDT